MCLDLQKNFPEVPQAYKPARYQPSSRCRAAAVAVCYREVPATLDQDTALGTTWPHLRSAQRSALSMQHGRLLNRVCLSEDISASLRDIEEPSFRGASSTTTSPWSYHHISTFHAASRKHLQGCLHPSHKATPLILFSFPSNTGSLPETLRSLGPGNSGPAYPHFFWLNGCIHRINLNNPD